MPRDNFKQIWQAFYYGLLNEVIKDRDLFVTPEEQLKEKIGEMPIIILAIVLTKL